MRLLHFFTLGHKWDFGGFCFPEFQHIIHLTLSFSPHQMFLKNLVYLLHLCLGSIMTSLSPSNLCCVTSTHG